MNAEQEHSARPNQLAVNLRTQARRLLLAMTSASFSDPQDLILGPRSRVTPAVATEPIPVRPRARAQQLDAD